MIFLETIRCQAGYPLHLVYHQKRLDDTCRHHRIPQHFELNKLISPPDVQTYRCRFLYSSEGFEVQYLPYLPKPIKKLKIIDGGNIEYPFKNADRKDLDTLALLRGEADDIVITKNGFLTDTTIANIALKINGRWFTPAYPLLKGSTRERLLDEKLIETADLRVEDILRCEKIGIMNAMIGFVEFDNGIII